MTSLMKKYKKWSLPSKIGALALILAIVITPIQIIYGEEIHNWFWGKTGLEITPKEIDFSCVGVTKTITLRNYDDKSVENFVLTISWPLNQSLTPDLMEVGSNSLRGELKSIRLHDNKSNHEVYFIVNIKPKDILEFDLRLRSNNCNIGFPVYINKYSPIMITGRI